MAQLIMAIPAAFGATAAGTATASQLALVGTTIAAGGMVAQGMAASAEAKSQQAIAEYNAKVQAREAKAIEARTAFAQRRQVEAGRRTMATMRARMGKAGVVAGAGTPLLIQAKQASELELENLVIGFEGGIEAGRAKSQADIDIMQAGIYKRKAKAKRIGGYMEAGATLLTGFS